MKKLYYARWGRAGQPTIGNVSFEAASDTSAKKKADKIAHEIGLPNTPRTISCNGRVIESLNTGTTN